jgi:hypothetical protein
MNDMSQFASVVSAMAHSPIRNYAIPGLSSSLLGSPSAEHGCVRLFECDRNHQEPITPHSHRFDFVCLVLAGTVTNRVWEPDVDGDPYSVSELTYLGEPGRYALRHKDELLFSYKDTIYKQGDSYQMKAEQIHSIFFSKGAKVLFVEGRKMADTSIALLPVVDGLIIDTLVKHKWQFLKSEGGAS